MTKIIALLTDFGEDDTYVGMVKGVISGISPEASIVDLTHAIDPQHVRQAAFALLNAYKFFPQGTIFMVVIDPGVGSERRSVVASVGGYAFVGPDNGVLSYALEMIGGERVYEIANSDYWLSEISNTFHGRDIFAPVAAHLAEGVPLQEMGEAVNDIVRLPKPGLNIGEERITGEAMHIDRFGNIITSIGKMYWQGPEQIILEPTFGGETQNAAIPAMTATVTINRQKIFNVRLSYSEAHRGDFVALIGNSGYLEIAINQGNAAERLNAEVGDRVVLKIGDLDETISD
jgi:S-adenosyl-L-methionine hydrolase (adenosine-forming)